MPVGDSITRDVDLFRDALNSRTRASKIFRKINVGDKVKVVETELNAKEKKRKTVTQGVVTFKNDRMFVLQLQFGRTSFNFADCVRENCSITILNSNENLFIE